MGTLRIIAELQFQDVTNGSGMWYEFATINFAHMAIIMFFVSVTVCIIVSLLTAPQSEAQLSGLSFGALSDEQKAYSKNSYSTIDIVASVVLIALVIGVLTYFVG
jgi:SSS family solute:Na+ symporter